MKTKLKTTLMGLVLVALAGCAAGVSTEHYVQDQNWQGLGKQDGLRGLPSRSAEDLAKVASEYGNGQFQFLDYEQGYLEGVDEYCIPSHAYQIGLEGIQYHGVCDSRPDGQQFRMEWQRGFNNYNPAGNGY
ncbi:DUF2799 domain-containing protein [Parasalinivibrio latis]|uniref:DUF2799 domain-containing protein n=1 Tax=Parasalinivibrio latis TaxID=2952610 RepID=UPI003DA5862C